MTIEQPVIRIFGVPMDFGQQRRGVDMGPSAVRYAGLQARLTELGYEVHDGGNIPMPVREQMEHPYLEDEHGGRARFLPEVTEACQNIYNLTEDLTRRGESTIFIGGDHSLAIGTVAAVSADEPVGLIWVDAHGDINTPITTPSGNVHGMPVAVLLGEGAEPLVNVGRPGAKVSGEAIAMIGIRSLDPPEKKILKGNGVGVYTMRHIDERGMGVIAREVLERLSGFKRLHISLDMDALDPTIAPGVGTPVNGGIRYREAHLLMEILAESRKVHSMDIVEINPILDDRNTTAQVAVGLAASLFGETIL